MWCHNDASYWHFIGKLFIEVVPPGSFRHWPPKGDHPGEMKSWFSSYFSNREIITSWLDFPITDLVFDSTNIYWGPALYQDHDEGWRFSFKIQQVEPHKWMLRKKVVGWEHRQEALLRWAGFPFSPCFPDISLPLHEDAPATILIISHLHFHNKLPAFILPTSNPSSTLWSQSSFLNANLIMSQTFFQTLSKSSG